MGLLWQHDKRLYTVSKKDGDRQSMLRRNLSISGAIYVEPTNIKKPTTFDSVVGDNIETITVRKKLYAALLAINIKAKVFGCYFVVSTIRADFSNCFTKLLGKLFVLFS